MTTMREKCARAIYDATDPTSDDPIAVTLHMSDHVGGVTIEEQREEVMQICRAAADAVLSTLLEPDEGMVEASARYFPEGFPTAWWRDVLFAAGKP